MNRRNTHLMGIAVVVVAALGPAATGVSASTPGHAARANPCPRYRERKGCLLPSGFLYGAVRTEPGLYQYALVYDPAFKRQAALAFTDTNCGKQLVLLPHRPRVGSVYKLTHYNPPAEEADFTGTISFTSASRASVDGSFVDPGLGANCAGTVRQTFRRIHAAFFGTASS